MLTKLDADADADTIVPCIEYIEEAVSDEKILTDPGLIELKPKRTRSRISKKIKPLMDADLTTSTTNPEVQSNVGPPPIANIILHLTCSFQDLTAYNESYKQQLRATSTFTYDPTVPPIIQAYNTERSELDTYSSYVPAQSCSDPAPPLDQRSSTGMRPFVSSDFGSTAAASDEHTTDIAYNHDAGDTLNVCAICSSQTTTKSMAVDVGSTKPTNASVIYNKLKKLKTLLYKNIQVTDKKSACFWCTYDFDTPECHIPFYHMNGQIHGYGVFCRPECAVGHLMKEHLDDSTKFERYHLLNRVYGSVFDYKKNIKPAPNPYYMLDRFCGNLSIEEYRALLQSNHVLFTIDKPMTRTLPELHEETDDVITSIYENMSGTKLCGAKSGIKPTVNHTTHTGGGTYKAKRQSEKVQNVSSTNHKTNILREHFGLGLE
jgi:hypothetical protein